MVYFPLEDLTNLGYTLGMVYLSLDIKHYLALGDTEIVKNLLRLWICGLRGIPWNHEMQPVIETIKPVF